MGWNIQRISRMKIFCGDLAYQIVRASMVFLFLIFGYQKWFEFEARGLEPLFLHGPLIYWMHVAFGVRGEAYFLGVSEWATAALLVAGFWSRKLTLLGSLVCVATFVCTVTIIPFFPSAWASEIGFPGMTLVMGFLMKDVVLLAVSLYMVRQDVIEIAADQEAKSAAWI